MSVALHRHSNALVDILPPEADSSISLLSDSERPDVTYAVSLISLLATTAPVRVSHEYSDQLIAYSGEPKCCYYYAVQSICKCETEYILWLLDKQWFSTFVHEPSGIRFLISCTCLTHVIVSVPDLRHDQQASRSCSLNRNKFEKYIWTTCQNGWALAWRARLFELSRMKCLSIKNGYEFQCRLAKCQRICHWWFLQDIGGNDIQKQEIKEAVELPLTHHELYRQIGIDPPRGVLLWGPPGTGKTMLAKAVAHHTTAAFIRVVGSEFVQKYLGEVRTLTQYLLQIQSFLMRASYRGVAVELPSSKSAVLMTATIHKGEFATLTYLITSISWHQFLFAKIVLHCILLFTLCSSSLL